MIPTNIPKQEDDGDSLVAGLSCDESEGSFTSLPKGFLCLPIAYI